MLELIVKELRRQRMNELRIAVWSLHLWKSILSISKHLGLNDCLLPLNPLYNLSKVLFDLLSQSLLQEALHFLGVLQPNQILFSLLNNLLTNQLLSSFVYRLLQLPQVYLVHCNDILDLLVFFLPHRDQLSVFVSISHDATNSFLVSMTLLVNVSCKHSLLELLSFFFLSFSSFVFSFNLLLSLFSLLLALISQQ